MATARLNPHGMRRLLAQIRDETTLLHRLELVQSQIAAAFHRGATDVLEDLRLHERLIVERRVSLAT